MMSFVIRGLVHLQVHCKLIYLPLSVLLITLVIIACSEELIVYLVQVVTAVKLTLQFHIMVQLDRFDSISSTL